MSESDTLDFIEWLRFEEAIDDGINELIDGRGLILFFKKGNEVFGAPEESRIMFARMKQPRQDDEAGSPMDGGFLAFNLLKSLMGDPSPNMFGSGDLNKIHVIDRDDAEKHLKTKVKDDDKKTPGGHPLRMVLTRMIRIIPNMHRAKPSQDKGK